jgi:Tol biopolymer transport system component
MIGKDKMKNVSFWKKALACSLWFLFVAMATVTSAAAQAVVPINGTPPTLIPVTINNSTGDQFNPHVSGDWAAYSSDLAIHYYNFATNNDAQIPLGSSAHDLLPDVSGSKIAFSRMIVFFASDGLFLGFKNAVMVFDAATPTVDPIEIDPASGTNRMGSAIGGNTVAYIDYGLHPAGELVIHDLVSTISVRITNDAISDQNPSVSPDGNVVTWEHCLSSLVNCDIWQAVKTGAVWSVSIVSNSLSPDANPDTNGSLVVYDSLRAADSDLFWRSVSGGAEVQLAMPGFQNIPHIAGSFIAFESRPTLLTTSDIFVYDIASNLLYQITNTPLVNEMLNDITVLPNGDLRVVWDSDEDGYDQRNIKAATFSLPSATPSPTELLQQLIDTVATFNLRHGILNSFDAKLENAQAALGAAHSADSSSACGMLSAFINEVQAQSGKAITPQEATQLINLANQVRAGLACP